MTTQSWSARVRHDSDATFREWGSDFAAKLAAVGLVQTSDTGQINWVTVTRPGINTNAGYEIWRFNDTQQGTAPIYLRIDYGTGSGATSPRMLFTVGTGSNGSGTITGTALSTARNVHGGTAQATDTARQSYMCAVDGFFGFDWKVGAGITEASFFICRTCDATGAPTATGAMVHWGVGASNSVTARQAFRFAATAVAYAAQTAAEAAALGLSPQQPSATSVGADIQVFLGWTITPRVEPLFGVCGVYNTELVPGGTFSATLVGSTPRTFLVWSNQCGPFGSAGAAVSGGMNLAMLWE